MSVLLVAAAYVQYQRQIDGDASAILGLCLAAVVSALIAIGAAVFERSPRWHRGFTAMGATTASISLLACLVFAVTILVQRFQEFANLGLAEPAEVVRAPVEVEPIPVSNEAEKIKENLEGWGGWLATRVIGPTMRMVSGRPEEAVTAEVMDAFARLWRGDTDRLSRSGWNRLAARYLETGARNPTCLLILASQSDFSSNVLGGDAVIERFRREETNAFWHFYFEMYRIQMLQKMPGSEKDIDLSRDLALAAFDRMLAEGFFDPGEMGMLADFTDFGFFPALFKARMDPVLDIVESHEVPDWLRELLMGRRHIRIAWQIRGTGYGDTVSESDWSGFREHLQIAREHLELSWKLAPHQPYAAKEMIVVSMGSSKDPEVEMRRWLDRAISSRVDWWPAYNAYLWGMRPRWHGSHEEMIAFADECLASKRFDTFVPAVFLATLKEIAEDGGSDIYNRPGIYEKVREMTNGYLAANPSLEEERLRRTTLAVQAYLTGHFEDLREQWTLLGGNPNPWELARWKFDRHDFIFRATVGEGSRFLREALEAADSGDFPAAIGGVERALGEPGLDPAEEAALEGRLALLRIRERYEEGEWIDLFEENRDLWRAVEGRFEFTPEGSMNVTSDSIRYAVDHPLRLGEHFEVELELETRDAMLNEAGPGVLLSDRAFDSTSWITCHVKRRPSGKRDVVLSHFRYAAHLRSPVPVRERMTLRLVCHDNEWKAFADGSEVEAAAGKLTSDFIGEDTRLALGGWTTLPIASHSQVFHGVRVRKLEAADRPGGEGADGSILDSPEPRADDVPGVEPGD